MRREVISARLTCGAVLAVLEVLDEAWHVSPGEAVGTEAELRLAAVFRREGHLLPEVHQQSVLTQEHRLHPRVLR